MSTGKFRKVVDLRTGEVSTIELLDAEIGVIAARLPETVLPLSPAQFWMQLAIDGDEAAALAIIDTLPRPQQILATKAKDYRRDNELLIQLATAMGKSSANIDAFFRDAINL